jgi:hypothetical protein
VGRGINHLGPMGATGVDSGRMTHEQAIAECSRLAREHPDRATHSWLPRELSPGQWAVVRVGVPTQLPLGSTTEAKPRPPLADDPRPAMWRDVGGPYGGG